MLTDIFANRYIATPIWESFGEPERRLLTQCYRNIFEQVFNYWINGKESLEAKNKITQVHDRLSMELGLDELAEKVVFISGNLEWESYYSFWYLDYGQKSVSYCQNWCLAS